MDFQERVCVLTVMDTISDPDISFDENGICNYYYDFLEAEKKFTLRGKEGLDEVEKIIGKIKKDGLHRDYDCILGLSGGVDSSYLACKLVSMGLRPLAVHFDNGWNSEIAVKNIEIIVTKLKLDLYSYVVDWEEFRDLQLAYLKASVVDVETVTDHGFMAALYKIARKYKIKHIMSGGNVATEFILPKSWAFSNKHDLINLKSIHKAHGKLPLKNFPTIGLTRRLIDKRIYGISTHSILNYLEYNKKEAIHYLVNNLGWQDYGGKHHESVFTKFFQGYILPQKFKIDKRKAHLSSLICSKQLTREEAVLELNRPIFTPEELKKDTEFVLRKLGLTNNEFEAILSSPPRNYLDYSNENQSYFLLKKMNVWRKKIFLGS